MRFLIFLNSSMEVVAEFHEISERAKRIKLVIVFMAWQKKMSDQ